MKSRSELLADKAKLQEVLRPLGFEDPDEDFLELVHRDTSVVISCVDVDMANVIERVFNMGYCAGRLHITNQLKDLI